MKNNYTSDIRSQIISAGFTLNKCPQENTWQILDKRGVVLEDRSMGCLMKKAAQTFGLTWENRYD